MTYLVTFAFVAILASLAVALVSMMRGESGNEDGRKSRRMARALAMRVGLSVMLFVVVIFSYHMGWIHPTGLPMR
jgi:TRAP-type C4-dicarboxylate transport system permease large subunit